MSEQAKHIAGGAGLGALAGVAGGKGLGEAVRWGLLKKLKASPEFAKKFSEHAFRKNPDKFGVEEISKKPASFFGKLGPMEDRLTQRPMNQDEIINLARKGKTSGKALAIAGLLGGGTGAYLGYKKLMSKYSSINSDVLRYMQQELVQLTKLANTMAAENVEALQAGTDMPHTSETSASIPQDTKLGPALATDPVKKERPFSLTGHNPKGRVTAFKGMFGRKAVKPGLRKIGQPVPPPMPSRASATPTLEQRVQQLTEKPKGPATTGILANMRRVKSANPPPEPPPTPVPPPSAQVKPPPLANAQHPSVASKPLPRAKA